MKLMTFALHNNFLYKFQVLCDFALFYFKEEILRYKHLRIAFNKKNNMPLRSFWTFKVEK